jgi:hypothetical protein
MSYPRVVVIGMLAACAACRPDAQGATRRDAAADASAISWLREIRIEENAASLSVLPLMSLDPSGGFLVADAGEAQVRRYGPAGELRWAVGRQGQGPGEFSVPNMVARLPNGDILAADRNGRFTRFDSAGTLRGTAPSPLVSIEDAVVLDDSLLLVSATAAEQPDGPRLHVWNTRSDRVVHAFFTPVRNSPNRVLASVAGWSKVSLRGDTVAAIFAPSDTVYLFDRHGRTLDRVPVPFQNFRSTTAPPPGRNSSPRQRAEWMSRFDLLADVHWLPNGDLLVAYQNSDPARASERQWHLLHMTRSGVRVKEIPNVPRLLDVDGRSGDLYFLTPGAEAPNRWSLARLR